MGYLCVMCVFLCVCVGGICHLSNERAASPRQLLAFTSSARSILQLSDLRNLSTWQTEVFHVFGCVQMVHDGANSYKLVCKPKKIYYITI